MACVTCLFVVLNIPLGLIGLVLIAVGACLSMANTLLKSYLDPLMSQLPIPAGVVTDITHYLEPVAIVFILIGCIFFILSIFACIGLCCRGKKAAVLFFSIYAIFAILFFLTFLGITILIGAPQQLIGSYIQSYLNTTLIQQYVAADSTDPSNIIWNVMQLGLQCCGTASGLDYTYAVKFNRTWMTLLNQQLVIPPTCCTDELLSLSSLTGSSSSDLMKNPLAMKACVFDISTQYSNYIHGCYDALFAKYNQYQWFCLGPCIGICLVLLFLVIVPVVFSCKNKKKSSEVEPIDADLLVTMNAIQNKQAQQASYNIKATAPPQMHQSSPQQAASYYSHNSTTHQQQFAAYDNKEPPPSSMQPWQQQQQAALPQIDYYQAAIQSSQLQADEAAYYNNYYGNYK